MAAEARPVVAVCLATGWLIASLLDSGRMAAVVVPVALVAVAWTAVSRRRRPLRLALCLLGLGRLVAALLATLLAAPDDALWIQVSSMALLIPLVPFVYAATFDRGDDRA